MCEYVVHSTDASHQQTEGEPASVDAVQRDKTEGDQLQGKRNTSRGSNKFELPKWACEELRTLLSRMKPADGKREIDELWLSGPEAEFDRMRTNSIARHRLMLHR